MIGSITKQQSEVERMRQLLARRERSIRDTFEQFVKDANSPESVRRINELLEAGDVEAALDFVDSLIVRFANVLPGVYASAGLDAAKRIAEQLGVPSVTVSFDPSDPISAEKIRQNRLEFIRQVTESQRDAIRQAVGEAFEQGAGPRQTARMFRDAIGLTGRQEAAVRNYRRLLEQGSAQALARDLRDKRFDSRVARADEEPLSNQQIDRMVQRYRERYRQFRAETIARTEGVRAMSVGQDEALRQVTEQVDIDPSRVRRVWNRTADARTRDAHDVMQGQEVGLNEPFVDGEGNQLMFPGDPSAPPSTTIQCRCVLTTRLID